MLKKYILEGDNKEHWPEAEFNAYWNPCITKWAETAKGMSDSFGKLEEFCNGGFNSGFRGHGVKPFFNNKAASKDSYCNRITTKTENDLFKQWKEGKLSLASLNAVGLQLKEKMNRISAELEEKTIPALEQTIRKNEQIRKSIIEEYKNGGVIKKPIIFANRFARVVELDRTIYPQKTELEALRLFTKPLCDALAESFQGLQERIAGFQNQVSDLYQQANAHATNLTDLSPETDAESDRDGLEDKSQAAIAFYKRRRLLEFEKQLLHDQVKMDAICGSVRSAFVESLQSNESFIHRERLNATVFSRVLLESVYTQIQGFHNELCREENQRVLGIPLLKRLQQKFMGNPTGLQQFAKEIVSASGIFAEIDMNQIQQHNANTPAPNLGQNIYFKRILINLPTCEDPDVVGFCNEFEDAIKGAISGGVLGNVTINNNNPNQNEVTILTMVNAFPMRALSNLPALKAKFDALITADPNADILLVTEGRKNDFRGLFALPPKTAAELREELMPKLIVNLSLGVFGKDRASEEFGPCKKDFFGNVSIIPWGHQAFTQIPFDDQLITDKETEIVQLYNESIVNAFAEVDTVVLSKVREKKEDLKNAIMKTVGDIMRSESITEHHNAYKPFVRWTEASVALVMEFNPNANNN